MDFNEPNHNSYNVLLNRHIYFLTQMIKQEHTSTCNNLEDPNDLLRKSNKVLSELDSVVPTQTPFEKMTVYQKRVALAKDVLMQLNIGKYNPRGTYLSIFEKFAHTGPKLVPDLFQSMKDNRTYCAVCAIGGLFVSHVVKREIKNVDTDSLTYGKMATNLKEIFSNQDLMLIEALFENWESYMLNYKDELDFFNNNFITRTEKMVGIMQNLINNEGRLIINDETLIK